MLEGIGNAIWLSATGWLVLEWLIIDHKNKLRIIRERKEINDGHKKQSSRNIH